MCACDETGTCPRCRRDDVAWRMTGPTRDDDETARVEWERYDSQRVPPHVVEVEGGRL